MITTNRLNVNIPPLEINGISLKFVKCTKFLGIGLDSDLKFKTHITHVYSKISKSIGVLNRLKKFVPINIMCKLYYSLIYPYLSYCNLVWANAPKTTLIPIVISQKKIIRIIHSAPFNSHTNELFHQSRMLKFEDVYGFNLGVYVYNYENNRFFTRNTYYNIRNSSNLVPSFQRLKTTQQSILFSGPKFWNSLPTYLKNISSSEGFKYKLKNFLLSQYNHSI